MDKNYYLEFENEFRGTRKLVMEKLSEYDSLIELSIEGLESPKLIDIGCGRGEWLERWHKLVPNSYGIECDRDMIKLCRSKGFNIIEGDALQALKNISTGSITVITIFHMIEHIEYRKLMNLLRECYRVLSKSGILIIETPSIDNLIVGTNTFHLDHTHITKINPEGLTFAIKKEGFDNVKHFFIHPGPLANSNHSKITRIFNGIAQDVLFIASKDSLMSRRLFNSNIEWQSTFDIGLTTIQAAIEFDLNNEKNLNNIHEKLAISENITLDRFNNRFTLLDELNNEFLNLKTNLKQVLYLIRVVKKIFKLLHKILEFIKKNIVFLLNKLFNILIKSRLVRQLIAIDFISSILKLFFRILLSDSSTVNMSKLFDKLEKIDTIDTKSYKFNRSLLSHYNRSGGAKSIRRLFYNRKQR